jgi:hypothetical protein
VTKIEMMPEFAHTAVDGPASALLETKGSGLGKGDIDMTMVDGAATKLSDDERHAFIEEATAFLEANAERRHTSTEEFRWGQGADDVRLMGGQEDGGEDERLAAARVWRAKVFDAGFGWLGGPVEYGGAGRSRELDQIYRDLEAEFEVPDQGAWGVAWEMVAPAVLAHGS